MTKPKIVLAFSGQGSQYFGMGRELFDSEPVFRRSMLELDETARSKIGLSIVDALYDASGRTETAFNRTLLTHPAIFMVEYSLARSLIEAGIDPDLTFGASLGSFAAVAVSGFISAQDALMMSINHALAIESHCKIGGMIAVLDDPTTFGSALFGENCELAAKNFSSHFAVAALEPFLANIEASLKGRGVVYQRLPVSFAFHSRWIDNAKRPFESCTQSVRLTTGRVPTMCCDNVILLNELPSDFFWNVTRRPIQFGDAVKHLEQLGSWRYIDVGPGGSFATFLKYQIPKHSLSKVHSILSPYGGDLARLTALTLLP